MATIQPSHSTNSLVFVSFAGFCTASVLSLAIAGAQLVSPHKHLATATAVAVTSRAISSTAFTSIYSAVVGEKLDSYIPKYIATAVTNAGLPTDSIPAFTLALTSNASDQLVGIPGVSDSVIQAGVQSLWQAYADVLRYPLIIAAPFALLAAVSSWFIVDLKQIMT
ncbi:uncharacterized protein A1O9_06379 [Exophiala aquamarina CBS 119918]|uniref:Major facilitator superfamily (MFS) profile domain-containing protein n=1 Tax=Exophiala aquamarina CBS 119918 TaxID=1182545 RepID=A0A072PGM2_9EURO|nr:uncharacterized protein A1O9_06379 [Exophiala aquamarina CBS 119918]KEF58453.1 hypothetical protein A1O9_06379 [Exophiala aquamarina CBS 119918]